MPRRNTPYGNIIYILIQLKVSRKWQEDLLSYPHPPPSFSLGLSTFCPPTFCQLVVFRAAFCKISEQFLLLVFFQFWDIWAAFSACWNWLCFHIAQCFSRQFMNFLWKRSQILTPWGQMMGARCSRAARSEGFLNKIQNGGRRFTLDWHECLRWRRSFNNFNGSY